MPPVGFGVGLIVAPTFERSPLVGRFCQFRRLLPRLAYTPQGLAGQAVGAIHRRSFQVFRGCRVVLGPSFPLSAAFVAGSAAHLMPLLYTFILLLQYYFAFFVFFVRFCLPWVVLALGLSLRHGKRKRTEPIHTKKGNRSHPLGAF